MSDDKLDLLTEPDRPGQLLPPDRVFYDEGVLLDAADLRDEQSYHRGRLARVLTYLHGSGTVAGLRVVWDKPLKPGDDSKFPDGREEELRVTPGVAVDRLGRLIEVDREWCVRLDRWYKAQEPSKLAAALINSVITVDIFLRFVPCERGRTPAFATGPYDALDAAVPSRIRDAFVFDLVLREESTPPLPKLPWNDFGKDEDKLHEALLDAWHEGTDFLDAQGRLNGDGHVVGQDTTSVFLARVTIPAKAGSPPVRNGDPDVDNLKRRFVYPSGALAAWLGVPKV
jgi:hypothetical protein